ncbi:hypothetical protein RF55_23221 [Lasius niger]|uniref:Uncharacterized protein n=1 Tax=Lasius niger TaxID=67767 RepID=A0A0J7MP35_LASNI|nr:hypothetical protein RF55_23221 [Lasius niger]
MNIEDVIIIDDSDEDMNIDEAEIDIDEEVEEDSDYESENGEDYEQVLPLNREDLRDITEQQIMCSITFYYKGNGDKFCSTCFIRVQDLYSRANIVHKHETGKYVHLIEPSCHNCGNNLCQVIACSVCPFCA